MKYKQLLAGYILLMIVLALLPINGKNASMNHTYVLDLRLDYLVHGLVFIPLITLACMAFPGYRRGKRFWQGFLLVCACMVIAAFCEIIQYPLTYRTFNVNDLAANITGVLTGLPGMWIAGKIMAGGNLKRDA